MVLGCLSALMIGCGGGDRVETADGDAGVADALDYEVTQDRYQRWLNAQQSLDALPGLPAPPRIDPMRLGEAEIARAVEYLEQDARAREALSQAGISARDYVLTTVALDQALVTASNEAPETGSAPTAAGRSESGQPAASAGTPAARGGSATNRSATRTAPRFRGTPRENVDLVRRNRSDLVRVMRTMRFRVAESVSDNVSDTSVTRSDSVNIGKDVTVKWDVTVKRRSDSAAGRSRSDSTRDTSSKAPE